MATQKTPTPPKQRAATSAHTPRNAAAPHGQTTAKPNVSHQEHQAHSPAHNGRTRQQTFGQRLQRLSDGGWLAILTGLLVIGIIVFAIFASRMNTPAASSQTTATTTSTASPPALLAVGTPAPDIAALPAADGGTYSLAQFKGQKVVVLEFFAPWCPHCQNETQVLKQLQQTYGNKGVQILNVSASPYGRNYRQGDMSAISMSDIQWYASAFGLNYPSLFDPSLKAGNDYHVTRFPTQYIVDKQGIITYAGTGEISYASLQQQVDQALNQGK